MSKLLIISFKKILIGYILISIFQVSKTAAQNSNLIFEKLSQKNGLSNNAIKCIYQDSRGFMWFGSINGLNRFDGKEFVIFNHIATNKKSISNDFINFITEDSDKNLWIGTAKGLNKYSPKTGEFYNFNNNPERLKNFSAEYISSLKITADGQMWIASRNSGLLLYNFKRNRLTAVQLKKGKSTFAINEIGEDVNKRIWIGTTDGLFRLKLKENGNTIAEKLLDVYVNKIYTDKKDNLLVGTTTGLYKLVKADLLSKNDRFINYNKTNLNFNISHNDVTAIYEDNGGELWLGTDGGGLNRSKTTENLKFEQLRNRPDNLNSLSQNQVFAVTQDFSGVLWVGTNDGINKVRKSSSPFIHFQSNYLKNNSLENNNLAAIKTAIINGQEYLICGSTGGTGLGIILSKDVHQNKENFLNFKDNATTLSSRKYQSFLLLTADSLLVGTKSGIRLFNLKTKNFSSLDNALNNVPKNVIRKIYRDGNGLIWIGTSKGLYIWDKKLNKLYDAQLNNVAINDNDYKSFVERSSLSNIFSITEDSRHNVWVGTWGGGLLKFKSNLPQHKPLRFTKKNSFLENNYLVSLLFNDSKLWIGSGKGLSYLKKPETADLSTSFVEINLANNAKKNHISGILADKNNNLWLASINGIINYDVKSGKVTSYDPGNGDLTKENYQTGLAKDAAGYLYFGGITGLVSFNPDSLKSDQQKYPIVLTDFRIFNKNQKEETKISSIYFRDKITLTPKEYAFSFSFSSLNYKISDDINYAYILEGIDKSWINIKSDQRFATYSNLSPGQYVLKVKATNEYNVWSAPEKLLTITVLTPWWLSWWAYVIYIITLCVTVYAIVRYVLEKERLKNNLAIERLEKQNVKKVDELKFRYFTNISHEFRTPLTLILGPLEQLYQHFPSFNSSVQSNLKHIQHNVSHLLRLINQLMDFRKMEEGNLKLSVSESDLSVFITELISNFDLLARKKNIAFTVTSSPTIIHNIWCDWDKLEKILNNLIHNALSFTPVDGKIIVDVLLSKLNEVEHLKISIKDSGKGIKVEELPHIFNHFYQADNQTRSFTQGYGIGLSLTKELVKIHRGSIIAESDGKTGSTFLIDIPVDRSSFSGREFNTATSINLQNPFDFPSTEEETVQVKIEEKKIEINKNLHTLLIVDDNVEIRNHLTACFSDEYKIVEAEDGKDGIEKAQSFSPDLIISDVMMPIMDGLEFCKKIKTDIITSHIPVILLTALTDKAHLIEGLETGADVYLTKPFYNEVLKLSVRNLIRARKKLRDQFVHTEIMEPSEVTVNSVDERFLSKAMAIVESNLANSDYDIENFVEEMGMGRSAFYRKLKQVSGQAPNEFIRTVRLKRAAQLLKKKAGTIAEISYETGFIDPAYFARCFKKQFGVTPSEFNAK